MATPGGFDMEAFRIMMQAMCETLLNQKIGRLENKIDQNIKELKEDNKSLNSKIVEVNTKIGQQSENFKLDQIKINKKLEQRTEIVKQATIKITESLEELKNGNIEIKQCTIDSNIQLTEKIVDTKAGIDALENNVKLSLHEQTVKCENEHKELRLEWRQDIKDVHKQINGKLITSTCVQNEKIQTAIDRVEEKMNNKIDALTNKIKEEKQGTIKYDSVYKLSYQYHRNIQINVYTQDVKTISKDNTSPQTRSDYHNNYKTRKREVKQNVIIIHENMISINTIIRPHTILK